MDAPPPPFDALAGLVNEPDPTTRAKTLMQAIDAVPLLQTWLRQAKQEAVLEMHETRSFAAIGKELGITRGRAQQIAVGYVGGRSARKNTPENAERPTVSDRALDGADGSSA